MTEQTNELYHSFQREERKAEVWRDPNGFYVKLYVFLASPRKAIHNHVEIK